MSRYRFWLLVLSAAISMSGCGDDSAPSAPESSPTAASVATASPKEPDPKQLAQQRNAQLTFMRLRVSGILDDLDNPSLRAATVDKVLSDETYTDTAKAALKLYADSYHRDARPTAVDRRNAMEAFAASMAEFRVTGDKGPTIDLSKLVTVDDVGRKLSFSTSEVFSENLEQTPAYGLPAALSNEEARQLILDTYMLELEISGFPNDISRHRQSIQQVVNQRVMERLWQRLVSGEGFKDARIGRDWYALALHHWGILAAVEQMLGDLQKMTGLAIAAGRVEAIKSRLIGGKYYWGDRQFVTATRRYLKEQTSAFSSAELRVLNLSVRLYEEKILYYNER